MDIEHQNGSMSNSHQMQGGSQNNINNGNPFFKLQHQNSYPPQMYYPPPPPMYYPPQGYIPPQQNQQPQGMFGNFIMNQLSQNMNGSNKNIPSQPYQKW